jgi:hypothetical protein
MWGRRLELDVLSEYENLGIWVEGLVACAAL